VAKDRPASHRNKERKPPKPTQTALRAERAKLAVQHAGLGFTDRHHVFIAKLKSGEVWAVNQLKLQTKPAITPLFEMWPPTGTKKKPAKSLASHTTDLMKTLAAEWAGLPCYIDTKYLRAAGVPSPASAQTVFDIARNENAIAIPVTSPLYGQAFQQVIRTVIATDGRGVMFRLPVAFFEDLQNLPGYLTGLCGALGVQRNQVDILIDLEHRPNVVEVRTIGAACLNALPFVTDWRTITLASGCFPASISDEPTGHWLQFSRSDWNGWLTIRGQRATTNVRLPSYGDYGVRCGGEPLVIPNSPAPNLRYSDPQTVWVRKGPKTPGSTRAICASLITQQYFSGPPFSQGDTDIAAKAATTNLTNGSAGQWIQWCTNHHLEMTASQIQNLP
jgi:hypothetical protein